MESNNSSYKMLVSCSNCNFKGEVEIPKSVRVNEHNCPNCEVPELSKYYEPESLIIE